MRLTIRKRGRRYLLKVCKGGCGEWYALPKENRCSLCGSGLRLVARGERDPSMSSDILEGTARENRKLLAKLPSWARERILDS